MLLHLDARHREPLADLLRSTPEFSLEDQAVALELIDDTLAARDTYRFLVDVSDAQNATDATDATSAPSVRGYICFGATPMTRGTFDLYWIAVHPAHKGHGVGRALVAGMETELTREGARLVRVETAGTSEYAATRAFYDRLGFEVVARIRDFYWPGNDLVIYGRYFRD